MVIEGTDTIVRMAAIGKDGLTGDFMDAISGGLLSMISNNVDAFSDSDE
ncbi:MAG: hypothetical protein ACI4W2_03280 [Eubacterium sp.]